MITYFPVQVNVILRINIVILRTPTKQHSLSPAYTPVLFYSAYRHRVTFLFISKMREIHLLFRPLCPSAATLFYYMAFTRGCKYHFAQKFCHFAHNAPRLPHKNPQ